MTSDRLEEACTVFGVYAPCGCGAPDLFRAAGAPGYTDSEVAARTIGVEVRRAGHMRAGIRLMMQQLHGAYAIVLATPESLYAFRDPNGIDTASRDQLISANMSADEACRFIGCDSLAFMSIEDLHDAVHCAHSGFCDACFSGDYPVKIIKGDCPHL